MPQRPQIDEDAFPSGPQALLLLLALFLAEYLIASLLHDARSTLGLNRAEIGALTVVLANGLLLTGVMQLTRLSYARLFHPTASSVAATLLLLLPPVAMLVPALLMGMGLIVGWLTAIAPLSAWEEAMFRDMASGGLASAVAVCLLAPLLEEMLFRGVILRGFLERYPRWQAIAGSALLFGAAHLNLYQFVVGLVVGLVSGWLYERSRSLLPCIGLHGAYNSALWVMSLDQAQAPGVANPTADAASWLPALALAALGALWLHRCLRRRAVD